MHQEHIFQITTTWEKNAIKASLIYNANIDIISWSEESENKIFKMSSLTGASKIVNLVVSVSKCALPTSTVLP